MESPSLNQNKPVRIAILGGNRVGKTSFATQLSTRTFQQTHYPTHLANSILFNFTPRSDISKHILDEASSIHNPKDGDVVYSPVIKSTTPLIQPNKKSTHNSLYTINKTDAFEGPSPYTEISPILIELIDTPAFNPDQIVPFLEASLYIKLDPNILKNLANEPRRPVSTQPLLVASGAGDMNGYIDGYFFIYSAIPTHSPPSYQEIDLCPVESNNSVASSSSATISPGEESLNLLNVIKNALSEAWEEYRMYQHKWKAGQESDIYSLVYSIKKLWNQDIKKNSTNIDSKVISKFEIEPEEIDENSPPPIYIIATNSHNYKSSPVLIEKGKQLAKEWKCGFIAVDNEIDHNVDESLSLLIREVVERKKLIKKKTKGKKH